MKTGQNQNRSAIWALLFAVFTLALGGCEDKAVSEPVSLARKTYQLPWRPGTPDYVDLYAGTLGGTEFSYHAAHPKASASLLLRSREAESYIEWQTVPVPADYTEPFITFAGLMSIDVNAEDPHRFDWYVNDNLVFSISSPTDTLTAFDQDGKDGARLWFAPMQVDRHGDLSGVVYLKYPVSMMNKGKALRIRIEAEEADSPTWLILFKHLLRPHIRIVSEQALLRNDGDARQLIRAEVFHMGDPTTVTVKIGENEPHDTPIKRGWNTLLVPVSAVESPEIVPVAVSTPELTVAWQDFALRPVTQREIWMLPHSHVDIGYTDVPPVVERKHWQNFRDAVEMAGQTSSYPQEAQYKWNAEVLWAVQSYLEQSGDDPKAFVQAVKDGHIGLDALYGNALTGISGEEELFELVRYANALKQQHGIEIESAMLTDVPGSTWGLIPVLAQSGIRYFTSGPNYDPSQPHNGDRIGYTLESWGDKPFYWVSQSGQDSVLFMMAGKGYSWFHDGRGGPFGQSRAADIFGYMNELDEVGYPYDMVHIRCGIGGDNGPIVSDLSQQVKQWNEAYVSPKIVLATNAEMCREFESRYSEVIPRLKGDMTEYWADGAASTARELATTRAAREQLTQAAVLHAISGERLDQQTFVNGWKRVVLFDEHTWGAHNSITDPDAVSVQAQWNSKQSHALQSREAAQVLSSRIVEAEGAERMAVYNTSSWSHAGLVTLPGETAAGLPAVTIGGNPYAVQRTRDGKDVCVIDYMKPLAAEEIIYSGNVDDAVPQATASGNYVENEFLRVTVDPQFGTITSLIWKDHERELVDTSEVPGLNYFQYVIGAGTDTAKALSDVSVRVGERGPVVASVIVSATAPGCRSYETEYRLMAGLPYLEVINRLDKAPVRDKESIHFGFPLLVEDGGIALDMPWTTVLPNKYQLKGANKNVFPVQRWADVFNSEYGVTLVTPDAPLLEIGGMTADEWQVDRERPWLKQLQPSQLLYSYAMNNSWHTNFKADQEGPVTFRYYLRPHGALDQRESERFGREICRPLVAGTGPAELNGPLFLLPDTGATLATTVVPQSNGDLLIRLFNPSAATEMVTLQWPQGAPGTIERTDPFGNNGEPLNEPFEMVSKAIVTLRVKR